MFDATFESPRRAPALAASALLHGLLGVCVVVASALAVHDPPEPPERILDFVNPFKRVEAVPVRLVDASRGHPDGGSPRASSPVPRRAAVVQPREIRGFPTPPAGETEPVEEQPVGFGEDESLGLGIGAHPGPVGFPDGGGPEDIRPANAPDVVPPVPVVTTDPVYPSPSLHLRQQGIVILEAIIGTDGQVRSARVLRSAGELLDRAAEQAVLRWRYRPARIGAREVAVYLTVTVRFSIAS